MQNRTPQGTKRKSESDLEEKTPKRTKREFASSPSGLSPFFNSVTGLFQLRDNFKIKEDTCLLQFISIDREIKEAAIEFKKIIGKYKLDENSSYDYENPLYAKHLTASILLAIKTMEDIVKSLDKSLSLEHSSYLKKRDKQFKKFMNMCVDLCNISNFVTFTPWTSHATLTAQDMFLFNIMSLFMPIALKIQKAQEGSERSITTSPQLGAF